MTSYSRNIATAQRLWHQMYATAVRWQTTHQAEYWRLRAINLERANTQLRERSSRTDDHQFQDNNKEEASSDDDDESNDTSDDDAVDEGYLAFLEISQRHKAEMKMKREAESDIN